MRKFLTTTAVLGLLVSPAVARDWTKEELSSGLQKHEMSRYVPSGVERMLGFVYALKLDCSSLGDIVVKKLRDSEHGSIEIVPGESASSYKADSKYVKCNDKAGVPGVRINYKSADDFVGPDNFKVLIMYPTGLAQETLYKIVVR
jgi:hypothetical protein